jgi:hypothetical protein
MKIQEKDYYHGAALTQIVEHQSFTALNKADTKYGHYKINHNIRLLVKSGKGTNTWGCTINENDLEIIKKDLESRDKLFLCLVCGLTTICIINEEQINELFDLKSSNQQWLSVKNKKNGSLWVSSRITALSHSISHNAFPDCLF